MISLRRRVAVGHYRQFYSTTVQSNANFLIQHYKHLLQHASDSLPAKTLPVSLDNPIPQYYKNYHEIIIPTILNTVSPKEESKKFAIPENWTSPPAESQTKNKEVYFNFRSEMAKLDSNELDQILLSILKKVMLPSLSETETIELYWQSRDHVKEMLQKICSSHQTHRTTVESILQQNIKECFQAENSFDSKVQEFYIHSAIATIQYQMLKEQFAENTSLHWILFRIFLDIYSHSLSFRQDAQLQQYNKQFHDFVYQTWLTAMELEEKQREEAKQLSQQEIDIRTNKAKQTVQNTITVLSILFSGICFAVFYL